VGTGSWDTHSLIPMGGHDLWLLLPVGMGVKPIEKISVSVSILYTDIWKFRLWF